MNIYVLLFVLLIVLVHLLDMFSIHAISAVMIYLRNYVITKVLNNLIIQKPDDEFDRHSVMKMAGFAEAMKPEKFTGVNFKRWQTRVKLCLSAMNVFCVVIPGPAGPRTAAQQTEYDTATTIFVRCILSVLSDQLCDVYMHMKNVADLWHALEHKFAASDAGHELYVMEKYQIGRASCRERV